MWSWSVVGLALVLVVVWALARAGSGTDGAESPETVLKRRYARGEIDREEYERRLSDLRK